MASTTLLGGLAGGLVATVAMTAVTLATGDDSPTPTERLWASFVADGEPERYGTEGMALHLAYGVLAGGVFAAALGALNVGTTPVSGLLAGVVYGVVLFAVGAAFWLVMVLGYSPDRRTALAFLLVHVVYGVVLGAWTGFGILSGLGGG